MSIDTEFEKAQNLKLQVTEVYEIDDMYFSLQTYLLFLMALATDQGYLLLIMSDNKVWCSENPSVERHN